MDVVVDVFAAVSVAAAVVVVVADVVLALMVQGAHLLLLGSQFRVSLCWGHPVNTLFGCSRSESCRRACNTNVLTCQQVCCNMLQN